MLIIDDVLISDGVLESYFICHLDRCKGACCYEGDFGAPLDDAEKKSIEEILPVMEKILSSDQIEHIRSQGAVAYYKEMKSWGTQLMKDGSCVFMTRDNHGKAGCGIEQAYNMGLTAFRKPISCHLYPIRVKENKAQGFTALNYDQWDICSAACSLGKEKKLPLVVFLKAALIRKFGEDFYEQLEAAMEHNSASNNNG